MLLPGHPGGVSWYEQRFWTPADICDLGQQGDLYTKTILGTPKLSKYQNYDIDSIYPPSLLFCAIYELFVKQNCIVLSSMHFKR